MTKVELRTKNPIDFKVKSKYIIKTDESHRISMI